MGTTEAGPTTERWIRQRLGDRKYRQLAQHLTGALRLIDELEPGTRPLSGAVSGITDPATRDALAVLIAHLRQVPSAPPAPVAGASPAPFTLRLVKGRRGPARPDTP